MWYKLLCLGLLLLLPAWVHAGNANPIYRWVDESGAVHYGDTVPDKYKDSASRKPELKEHPVIDVEGTAREQRARQQAREVLNTEPAEGQPGTGNSANGNQPAPTVSENTADMTCEEQWERYNASQACFAPFRLANGAIRPEAFDNCVTIPQPPRCE